MDWLTLLNKAVNTNRIVYDKNAEPGVFSLQLMRLLVSEPEYADTLGCIYVPAGTQISGQRDCLVGPEEIDDAIIGYRIFGHRVEELPASVSNWYQDNVNIFPDRKWKLVLGETESGKAVLGAF